jgi:hypothetical protein
MDIELLDREVDWNQVEFETMEKLKAVNGNVTKTIWNQPDSLLSGMTMYHADNKEDWVQAFIIKNHSDYPNMRITIHMPKDDVRFSEFLAMARTVMQNKKSLPQFMGQTFCYLLFFLFLMLSFWLFL